MQTAAEDARFDCARKMTEVESRKRYEFLEAMVSSMDAHLRFFERGHEVRLCLLVYVSMCAPSAHTSSVQVSSHSAYHQFRPDSRHTYQVTRP